MESGRWKEIDEFLKKVSRGGRKKRDRWGELIKLDVKDYCKKK